ncbi:TIGR02206 family membrane protein [Paucisalibacillus sp. EB02]|uniref:YwaF family protein n=1 Tax=Paucisalibacillus sp. EB02 TaxID=1347087 RepID=UPI0004B3DECE|nr:TIGR02206 family membrane protein [Paucisalibacillus sp. EB02]
MGEWFGSKSIAAFNIFGWHHVLMITLYLIGMGYLLIYFNKLKQEKRLAQILRWGLFIILVCSELSYQIWGIINGTWNSAEFLPFQLCSIAGILTMLALLTQNHKLIQIVFFVGIVPSFLAVITPELQHGYPHFRFWQFFIHHIVLSWGSLYLVVSNPITITFKKTMEAYVFLLVYAGIIGFLVNPIFEANFLFLARTPSANTPLDLLGIGFWYYFNLCLVGLIVFLTLFVIYKLFRHFAQKKS